MILQGVKRMRHRHHRARKGRGKRIRPRDADPHRRQPPRFSGTSPGRSRGKGVPSGSAAAPPCPADPCARCGPRGARTAAASGGSPAALRTSPLCNGNAGVGHTHRYRAAVLRPLVPRVPAVRPLSVPGRCRWDARCHGTAGYPGLDQDRRGEACRTRAQNRTTRATKPLSEGGSASPGPE